MNRVDENAKTKLVVAEESKIVMEHKHDRVVHKELLEDLECPVCRNYMSPPVRQCLEGHSVCNQCFMRVSSCPECRSPLSNKSRNLALEKLYGKLSMPCKNADTGCGQVQLGHRLIRHEMKCPYQVKECPLRVNARCSWVGYVGDMVDHCGRQHNGNVFYAPKHRLKCTGFFKNRITGSYYLLFNVYGHFFRCSWDVNFRTGIMRWCVFLLGRSEQEYEFGIEVRNVHIRHQKIRIRGPCPSIDTNNYYTFDYTNYMITHVDMLKTMSNDDFEYSVHISPKYDCLF